MEHEVWARRDDINTEVVLFILLAKALSVKDYKPKEYKPNCSVLSSQLQEKSGSVFVHIGLHLREILKYLLAK